jgi:hypothetical protein
LHSACFYILENSSSGKNKTEGRNCVVLYWQGLQRFTESGMLLETGGDRAKQHEPATKKINIRQSNPL